MHSYRIRAAALDDFDGARAVMLDAVYCDLGTGFVPRWHADIIDPAALWESLAVKVCDERREVPDGGSGTVHFEIPL